MKKAVNKKVPTNPNGTKPFVKFSKKEKELTYRFTRKVMETVYGIREKFKEEEIKLLEKKHNLTYNNILVEIVRLTYAQDQKDMVSREEYEALENQVLDLQDQLNKPLPDNIPNKKYDNKDFDFVIRLKERDSIPFDRGVDKLIEKFPNRQINKPSFLRRLSVYYNSHPNNNKNRK